MVFIKTIPNEDKAAIFAFDYNVITKAKHLLQVKAGRVKVTARARRKFDAAGTASDDQPLSQSSSTTSPHSSLVSGVPLDFVTNSGIKVSVYKTDITKLPVDAVVNAANEQLNHGGGVAAAISRAAGYDLEDEGRAFVTEKGPLKVTDVVATTGGNMPCKKVLHAVGPRWVDYTDKGQCRQFLKDTVFNCLQKASNMGYATIALPSISAGDYLFT